MIERLRKDPQNPTKFVKICDKCNTAYLERQMLMPFWKQYQKIKIVVDDREKKYETLTVKVNKVEAEVVNITRLVRTSVNQNGSKACDVEQRYAKLEGEQRELTSDFDTIQDEMSDLMKKLTRLDNEYVRSEIHMKEQRIQFEKLYMHI